jgi:hypothetical protein
MTKRKTTQKKKQEKTQTNSDIQNATQKTKDRVTRTSSKTGGELRCSGAASSAKLFFRVFMFYLCS